MNSRIAEVGAGCINPFLTRNKSENQTAFEPGTDSYQVGVGYNFNKSFTSKLRFTRFDNPIDNADLVEYTLNLAYNFDGVLENWSVAVDFSVLDYENGTRDATDLRTRLVYAF